jgi:hypothetical protein
MAETVKIFGMPFTINYCERPDETDLDVAGLIVYDKQEIRIRKGLKREYAEYVKMHELVHAIFFALSIDQDETDVDRLARCFYTALKDNPKFFKAIIE